MLYTAVGSRRVVGTRVQPGRHSACHIRPLRAASADTISRRRLNRDIPNETFRDNLEHARNRELKKRAARQDEMDAATRHVPSFPDVLRSHAKWPLSRDAPTVLQVNIGEFCNLTCRHCHVESGPTKIHENMDLTTVRRCLEVLGNSPCVHTVDITGGAPELNPHFRTLVKEARAMGKTVIDRCNLVVLFEKGQEDLPGFLAEQGVNIVASLPCYTAENTDQQRGRRVFRDSIEAIKTLNKYDFGRSGFATPSGSLDNRRLDMVYNPGGPSLPPSQANMEREYRSRLWNDHRITFNSLYTLTNMPIKRFADTLMQTGRYTEYMQLLVNSFNHSTVNRLMCRYTVNVSWDGKLYDCDFNSALKLGINDGLVKDNEISIWDIDSLSEMKGGSIRTAKHCFGCTAGSGSSCGGSLADP